MKKIYEKYKGRLVRLPDGVVGVVCGFTNNRFVLAVDDITIPYSFTIEYLGEEGEYYVEAQYLEDCDLCLFVYCDENQIRNANKSNSK